MGFAIDLFQEKVDDQLICSLCSEVFEEPVQVAYFFLFFYILKV